MKKIFTIGRGEGCDIVIADNSDIVSRLHATIRIDSNDKIYITDQSRNGTYVNGIKMSSNVEIPVSRKDVISFAHIYNLDWSLIPKQRRGLKLSIIVLSLLLILGLVAFFVLKLNKHVVPVDPIDQTTEFIEKKDTTAIKDSVEVKPVEVKPVEVPEKKTKPQPAKIKPKEDPVEEESPEMHIPIY